MGKTDNPICLYEQYHCCPSHTDCRLYHICSQLPKKPFTPNSRRYRFKRPVPLSSAEIQHHNELYRFYNKLWGDLKKRTSEYCKKNHERRMEYQRQYRARKNPPKEFSSVLYDEVCDRDCENCAFDDCMLPIWKNKQEYDALYYQKNREIIIQRSREWYLSHKNEVKAIQRKYVEEHKEKISAQKKKYWAENREQLCAQKRKYYEEHKEEILAQQRQYRLTNRELINAHKREKRKKAKSSA